MGACVKGSSANAIAIDLGATSVRFAKGTWDGSRIYFEIVEQTPHEALEEDGRPCWDVEKLLGFCRMAVSHAKAISSETTIGIDAWGVDHGFVDSSGKLRQLPVCYRDPQHQSVFDELAAHRPRLYELTGIAHQPFNTIYQLIARKRERPALPKEGRWLILPELFALLLGSTAGHEVTQASTTQLMGTDGSWSQEAFQIAGWPVPDTQPQEPGSVVGKTAEGVRVVRVGSHDTASAVLGLGALEPDEAFLNVGTWSLLGCILDRPLVSAEAEAANFSNEWTVDGRIRFLKNIPGFYIVNRLFEDLDLTGTVPDWIDRADQSYAGRIDPLAADFFNPPSMLEAVRAQLTEDPPTAEAWSGIALMSLVEETARQLEKLEAIVNKQFTKIRVAGGGSNSRAFCEALANVSGRAVLAGPGEATVLGNLGAQFLAQGHFASWQELGDMLRISLSLRTYHPGE